MDILNSENHKEPKTLSTNWIENLAMEEINMDESGVVAFNDHLNPIHLLEESSINFLNNLRESVDLYVSKFNELRGSQGSSSQIKLFKISNTVNDFMLFRNSLRLIFARKANDLISIGFLANGKDLFSARMHSEDPYSPGGTHEVRAHLGPFNKITWRFQGEEVDMDALVRHYLAEFIVNSSR